MSEYTIGFLATFSGLGLLLSSLLYFLGGRKDKWLRRFLGSAILTLTLLIVSYFLKVFSWWLLLTYVPITLGYCLPYGAELFWSKVGKRTIYALCVISSGLICAIVFGGNAWFILPLHIGVGLFTVYLGVTNPIHAASEEFFASLLINLGLIMYPFFC